MEYNKQRNKCTNLFRKAKRDYYRKLRPASVTDNKTFWKNVKPLFSDKRNTCENIRLVENNRIISEDGKIAQCFGEYFDNAIKSICMSFDTLSFPSYSSNPVIINIIEIYKNHPSVLKIKSVHDNSPNFSFSYISVQLMKYIILILPNHLQSIEFRLNS